MTRTADHIAARRDPIVRARNSIFRALITSLESGGLTIVVKVRIHDQRGARVDRDHDHLLREFMEAGDE